MEINWARNSNGSPVFQSFMLIAPSLPFFFDFVLADCFLADEKYFNSKRKAGIKNQSLFFSEFQQLGVIKRGL